MRFLPLLLALPVLGLLAHLAISQWRFRAYLRHKGLELTPLGPLGWLAYHLREVVAMAVVGWWQLRALGQDRLRVPPDPRPQGVLCIHGFTQNGTNLWGVRRALEERGFATRAVSMGRPFRPIAQHGERVIAALHEMVERFPAGVVVVAHSMGGVVLRHVLASRPDLARGVRRIVTVASPHAGTAVVRGLGLWDGEVRQIGRRSSFLAELPDLCALTPGIPVVTIGSLRDLVVYPGETCHEPGSRAVHLDHLGHAGLLVYPDAIGSVVEAVEAPADPGAAANP